MYGSLQIRAVPAKPVRAGPQGRSALRRIAVGFLPGVDDGTAIDAHRPRKLYTPVRAKDGTPGEKPDAVFGEGPTTAVQLGEVESPVFYGIAYSGKAFRPILYSSAVSAVFQKPGADEPCAALAPRIPFRTAAKARKTRMAPQKPVWLCPMTQETNIFQR